MVPNIHYLYWNNSLRTKSAYLMQGFVTVSFLLQHLFQLTWYLPILEWLHVFSFLLQPLNDINHYMDICCFMWQWNEFHASPLQVILNVEKNKTLLTCICIASWTRTGIRISRISYLRQSMPHASEAYNVNNILLNIEHHFIALSP